MPRTLEHNRPDLVPDRPRTYVPSVDILTDVLDRVRLKGTVLFHYEFGRPWSVALPRSADAVFHYLSRGSASIALEDGAMIQFRCLRLLLGQSLTASWARALGDTLVNGCLPQQS